MLEAVTQFFSAQGLVPHGYCLLWDPGLIGLHVGSDALIAASYFSIPAALLVFANRRRDLAYGWIITLFVVFILACGTTHVMNIVTLWYPDYALEGAVKALTAAASVLTSIVLWTMMRRLIAIPSDTQLHGLNATLESEIAERRRAQAALRDINEQLERRVAERTQELRRLNGQLSDEVAQRNAVLGRLHDANATLSAIVAASPQAIVTVDRARRVTSWNPAAARIHGYSADEALGNDPMPLVATGNETEAQALFEEAIGGTPIRDLAVQRTRRDGTPLDLRHTIAPLHDPEGNISGIIAITEDITQQKKSEAALIEREARTRSILETVPDAIIVIDGGGRIESFSPSAERLFGWKEAELIGRNVKVLMPSSYHEQYDDYLARYAATGERRIIGRGRIAVGKRKDGSTFPMELAVGEVLLQGAPRFTGFVRDITERQTTERRLQELQAELMRVSRLNAMGQMGAALAHELNQPLTAIVNYLEAARQLLARPTPAFPRIEEAIGKSISQALRAGDVIRRLRQFVTSGTTERRAEDINNVVEEASALALIGAKDSNIRIDMQFAADLAPAHIDKVQIQQVILNLVRNAVEAMMRAERRELAIMTRKDGGEAVEVLVRDTGPGLAPEISERLFQPFLSTKEKGMGVGLSICRSIINSHGGTIWARPNPDGGMTFGFSLPAGEE